MSEAIEPEARRCRHFCELAGERRRFEGYFLDIG
jgi:hypothetical protein